LVGKADFKNLEAYITAALLYWGLTILFSSFQSRLEARIGRGYDRTAVAKQLVGHRAQTSTAARAQVEGPGGGPGGGPVAAGGTASDGPPPAGDGPEPRVRGEGSE